MRGFLIGLLALVALCVPASAGAQIVKLDSEQISTDSLRRAFADTHYYFGLYKDNYFIFGPPIGKKPTNDNTNIKFQISIAQKLTKTTLPWGTYLYLYYTQKVFWNVLQNSMPMTDLNFNPGVGLAKPIFIKDRFIGRLQLQVEHESNGRDGDASRSWNKVTLGGSVMVDPNFVVYGKFWIPIVDGMNNKDILKYCGIYQVGWQFQSMNRKWSSSVTLVKRSGWNLNYNIQCDVAYRFSTKSNQYLYAQYYCGYGEGLLAYKEHHSQLRIGIVIKPTLFSEY
ncbi:MAG: phospholipase A [Muribaculaceae bacterium]|nr:phospholipase A [Muribaculaceae bacterium]